MKPCAASAKSDWLGMLSSLACLLHCLALPMLFYVFHLNNEIHPILHHRLLDYAFALLATVAVVSSVRRATSRLVRTVLIGMLCFFVTGLSLEEYVVFADGWLHQGSLGLITGHLLNLRQHSHSGQVS